MATVSAIEFQLYKDDIGTRLNQLENYINGKFTNFEMKTKEADAQTVK